jgi:RNA ligase (TIGR02306 family)
MDVSEILGIIKWEPQLPAHLAGHTKGTFPGWLPKTDEERVQNMNRTLENRVGTECYITEKLHGTSFTAYLRDGEFGVCSRNQEKKNEPGCLYWETAKKQNVEAMLRKVSALTGIKNVACQGELCGPGVNKNTLKLKDHQIFMFDLFDIDKYEYFGFSEIADMCYNIDSLVWVPFIRFRGYLIGAHTVQELVALVDKQKSTINPDVMCEGFVYRECFAKEPSRLSFKVINNTFLLKVDKDA